MDQWAPVRRCHGEIGDIWAWQTSQLGGYTVQLEWSNNKNSCG